MPRDIVIYTDGSALGNPGRGGYGVVMLSGRYRRELSQGYTLTTNNRMELTAVIAALEQLRYKGCNVTIYSDSKYVVDAISKKWLDGWFKRGFQNRKNADLWRRYLKAAEGQNVRFMWIKGHAGTPENEYCDRLAVAAANSPGIIDDTGYLEAMGSGGLDV